MVAVGALLRAGGVVFAVFDRETLVTLAIAGGVFGLGIGVAYASTASITVESMPTDRTGIATGVNANLRTIGSAVGSAFTTAVVFGAVEPDGPCARRLRRRVADARRRGDGGCDARAHRAPTGADGCCGPRPLENADEAALTEVG